MHNYISIVICESAYGEELAHDLGSGAAERLTEGVEVLQVGLVERVAHDLDVELVEVVLGYAVHEVGRERRVDQNGVVETGRGVGHRDGSHLLEHAEWVALGQELLDAALMQVARDQQHNVVDHIAVTESATERANCE